MTFLLGYFPDIRDIFGFRGLFWTFRAIFGRNEYSNNFWSSRYNLPGNPVISRTSGTFLIFAFDNSKFLSISAFTPGLKHTFVSPFFSRPAEKRFSSLALCAALYNIWSFYAMASSDHKASPALYQYKDKFSMYFLAGNRRSFFRKVIVDMFVITFIFNPEKASLVHTLLSIIN